MVTAQRARFQPSQLVQGTIRVRNSGTTPAILALRVTPGTSGILGFSPEASSRTVLTPRAVGPGDTVAIPVSIRLPASPGQKSFRVEVGEADASGQITRILDTQEFTNLAEILSAAAPAMVPLPSEVPAPTRAAALTPAQAAAAFQEALGGPSINPIPGQVTQGNTGRGRVNIPTGSSSPFSPQLRILLVDSNNATIRTLVSQRLSVAPGASISQTFNITTTDLAPGFYGVRVSLLSPTGQVLLDPVTFPNVLQVVAREVAAPPPPPELVAPALTAPVAPPIAPLAPTPPTTTIPISAARLETVGSPTLSPLTGPAGRILTGRWTVRNAGGRSIRAFLFLDGPGGGVNTARTIDAGEQTTLQSINRIPESQSPGTFTYGLALRDVNNPTPSLQVRTFRVEVTAPTAAPTTAIPTPTPTPTVRDLRPGDLAVFPPNATPRSVRAGSGATIDFTIQNFSGIATNVSITLDARDPSGREQGTGRGVVALTSAVNKLAVVTIPISSGAPSGSYSVRILIVQTGVLGPAQTLIDRTFSGVFAVT